MKAENEETKETLHNKDSDAFKGAYCSVCNRFILYTGKDAEHTQAFHRHVGICQRMRHKCRMFKSKVRV